LLINFFFALKGAGIPVSIKEFLHLLEALQKNVTHATLDEFYYLARLMLVKSETNFDKYDKAFAAYFKGINQLPDAEINLSYDGLLVKWTHLSRQISA